MFIGRGSSAVGGRSFKTAVTFVGKGEGEASGAGAGGACADGACAGGASIGGACVGGAITFIGGAVTFIGAITFIGGAVAFIGKGSLAIGGRSFKTARARARVVDNVKGVNKRDLRQ